MNESDSNTSIGGANPRRDDAETNDASGESRRVALDALTEDELTQRQERVSNMSYNLPLTSPRDEPANRSASLDVEHTSNETDALKGCKGKEHARKRHKALQNVLEYVRK